MKRKSNQLATYLTLTAGIGCSATIAEGAITAFTFAPGTVKKSSDSVHVPDGINFGLDISGYRRVDLDGSSSSYFALSLADGTFTSGTDVVANTYNSGGKYSDNGSAMDGAVLGGAKNYASISFDGNDGVYEAVGEFVFDGQGGGYMSGLAIDDTGAALSISQGKAAIDAVPEPSALALLALGSVGLLARRNRKQQAV